VRLGATLVAASVVAVALTTGAFLFWLTVRTSLYDGLQAGAEQDAAAVASQLEEGGSNSIGELDDDRLVQVVDPDGVVVAASEGAPSSPIAGADDDPVEVRIDGETYVTAVETIDGGSYVVTGRSAESAESTLATVGVLLVVAVPVLVGLVALTAWIGVGRALSPVERMRRQVDGVTAATLAGRIDVPETGDEIARLARTLNDMLDRLAAAQEQQRRFVSDASHELKSPLAAIRQYAEVARDHPDRISERELSEAVLDEGERLDRLVQGMLVLAQVDEGVLRVDAVDVDLDDLLFEEARRIRETGALDVDISRVSAVRVHGDPGLLRQLVRNLADNAARHARHRVELSLRTVPGASSASAGTSTGTTAELRVEDDGDGIPVAERARVFERFVRLDAARARDTGGSGLGLSIVQGIAAAHGGSVRVGESASGGASVIVSLPAVAVDR
jgi:signal transduction histidine kinase